MQNAALRHCGIAARYARFQIRRSELPEAVDRARELGFIGLNLTVPHKSAALQLLDDAEDNAQIIGSVNTISLKDARIVGYNTDGVGFSAAISEEWESVPLSDFSVLILGAGGAARAIAAECVRVGCAKVFVCNRTRAAADALISDLARLGSGTAMQAIDHSRDAIRPAMSAANLIVNATSVGLQPDDKAPIDGDLFSAAHFVYDTIYNAPRTKLLVVGQAAGARIANGSSMLLQQGARAFEIWFKRKAPVAVMRAALRSVVP